MSKLDISRKTRNRFKEHTLVIGRTQTFSPPWINGGRPSRLCRCEGHCDWLGWIPIEEIRLLEEEKAKAQALASR